MREPYTPDGTPTHSGQAERLTGNHPMYNLIGLMEGVVLKAHYKDDSDNRSKSWTEYDVMEVSTRQRFKYARVSSLIAGVDNGIENTLAETTGTTDGSPLVLEDTDAVNSLTAVTVNLAAGLVPTPTYKMNGERVLFACLSSAHSQSIIVGVIPHPASSYFANRAETPRSLVKMNGWTNTIAKDKSLSFVHEDGRKIIADAEGNISLTSKDGEVTINIKADGTIELGNGATEQIILGTTYLSQEQSLFSQWQPLMQAAATACHAATTPATALTAIQAVAVMLDAMVSVMGSFLSQYSSFGSNVSKTK